MSVSQAEQKKRLDLFSKVNRLAASFHNANVKLDKMVPIDLGNEEVIGFLKSLADHDVKYILVGGFAVAFHGYVRATHDLDLWIKDEPGNIENLKRVLTIHGVAGLDSVRSLELIPGFTEFAIGDSGFIVEPIKNLKAFSAFDFDACYDRADTGSLLDITFKVIHPKDLLQEKKATNRPKDQGDIEYLKNLSE
jgi:predicted nucleotidyltransferase